LESDVPISAEEFRTQWNAGGGSKLITFHPKALAPLKIPVDAKEFLTRAGLPESAPPFLTFDYDRTSFVVPKMTETWTLPAEFARYRQIGETGNEDPICLDEESNGMVVCLNHEGDFERVFINSSVAQLAECLLVFRELVKKAQAERGSGAFLNGDVPEHVIDWAKKEFARIDELSIFGDAMWEDALIQCNSKE
jgi:hypothetical protein